MASTTGAGARRTTSGPSPTRRGLQAAAVLSLLAVGWQFVTAGQLVGAGQALGLHAGGALALHVATALAVVAAVLHARAGGSKGVAVLAGVLFALTFLQAWSGSHWPLTVHVPLALAVVVAAVWLLVASVVGADPARRSARG